MPKKRTFFNKRWFSLLAFSSLILSCIYGAILQNEFKRQEALDLKLTAMKSISTMPPYILSMITMHNLCNEFNKLSVKEKTNNRFYDVFHEDMFRYIRDRANFAGSVAVAEFYFNDEINKRLNSLLNLERYYGNTPEQYCSNKLLNSDELYQKQTEIINLAYQQYKAPN